MLTEEMLIELSKNGFEFISTLDFNFRKKKPGREIFAFRIKIKTNYPHFFFSYIYLFNQYL